MTSTEQRRLALTHPLTVPNPFSILFATQPEILTWAATIDFLYLTHWSLC
jgi:hypothetical protein